MIDPDEHALVMKALRSGLSNCVEWISERTILRIRNDPDCHGLTPEGIRQELLDFIRAGGEVIQKEETRPEYAHYRFFYKAVLPIEGFPRGFFVELVLHDDDPDYPEVRVVNAHPQHS
jgi:hypothetical protein